MNNIVNDIKRTGWLAALLKGSDILAGQQTSKIVFYRDGLAGFTVVLEENDLFGNISYSLVISGKPDASSYGDMPTQTLMAHIPMLFHSNAKTVMVLGLASGITAGEVLCYPVERLDVLEISRDVAEASKFFDKWNSSELSNPKTNLIVQDGRAHLQLTDRKYDVIISEPSNPWMAGLATLFTREFFTLAKDRLNDDGIFAQFIHTYQLDWPAFAMVAGTFAEVYPNNALFRTRAGDYVMLGFKGNNGLSLANVRKNIKYAQQSKNIKLSAPELVYGIVMTEDISALCGDAPVNSDAHPLLEFMAPKVMYVNNSAVEDRIIGRRTLKPESANIVTKAATNVDMQIAFAEMCLSVHNQFPNMVNLSIATETQKKRYFDIIEKYCADNEINYYLLPDENLKNRCRDVRIASIERNLDNLNNKILAYYTLGDLCRENNRFEDAEKWYLKALELRPGQAETRIMIWALSFIGRANCKKRLNNIMRLLG